MMLNPLFYQLLLVALIVICLLLHIGFTDSSPRVPSVHPASPDPPPPRHRRPKEPKPFAGLIHKPPCEACELHTDEGPKAPGSPPPLITFTRGRPRIVDTHMHFCPSPDCS